ncbi:MAG: Type 1 glutamine amidotransferase-like domain-containing protein [Oligoflexia bacterium]|nr:Type 1 glutamine amidotransferase-like domain-containing protein [Oligoflexia bacterium]
MRLLLMSQTAAGRTEIERAFLSDLSGRGRMAYLPSKSDPSRKYFKHVAEHFLALSVEAEYCDLDQEFQADVLGRISDCEVIYLSGGLTPYFLRQLRARGAMPLLARHATEGKHLIGVSAGGIIMSPSIDIIRMDPEERGAISVGQDTSGLGLFDFEFFPHFGRHAGDDLRLRERSRETGRAILACDDASGVVLRGGERIEFGRVCWF